jgi:hypothetical protein
MRWLLPVVTLVMSAASAFGQEPPTYTFSGLTADDVLVIGKGLDKLSREETDKASLYQRLQAQITAQSNAFAQQKAEAEKKALDEAVEKAIAAKGQP